MLPEVLLTLTPDGWQTDAPELVEAYLYRAGIDEPAWPMRGESVALITESGERIIVADDGLPLCPLGLLDAVLAVLAPELAMT